MPSDSKRRHEDLDRAIKEAKRASRAGLTLAEKLKSQKQVKSLDDAPSLGSLLQPIETICRWYEDNILRRSLNAAAQGGEPAYLLFDEVQNLAKWSVQLKMLADQSNARIVVTGSSALRIAEGQDNLAGRLTTIELGPLRLTEIAGIRDLGALPVYAPDSTLQDWRGREFWLGLIAHGRKHGKVRDEAFRAFSQLGGYPLCHSVRDVDVETLRQQLISEVITKTLEHDAGHRPRTPKLESAFLREVFRLVCRYAGQAPRPKRIAEELQTLLDASVPNSHVEQALSFLNDSLPMKSVPPLEMLAKKSAHPSKLCLCDHFVRDGVLQETLPLDPEELKTCAEVVATQVGHVIESTLGYFLRGIPGVELSWFPSRGAGKGLEGEIDLVLTIGTGRIPMEVKYRRGDLHASDVANIESFCNKRAYAADFGLIVTQTAEGPIGERAIAVPAATLLMAR